MRPQRRNTILGVAFILPNILGFVAFTLFPLAASVVVALTNWDLRRHNMFQSDGLRFAGLANFSDLLFEHDFWRFLGNTAFMMMGIPFGIAGSLLAAILLSQNLRGSNRRVWASLVATAGLSGGLLMLCLAGAGASSMTLLVSGAAAMILVAGTLGGSTIYRTLFYLPNFTAGVATYILWKKLYSPYTGPINEALHPVLNGIARTVNLLPPQTVQAGAVLCILGMVWLTFCGIGRLVRDWLDGEAGLWSTLIGALLLLLPAAMAPLWGNSRFSATVFPFVSLGLAIWAGRQMVVRKRAFTCSAQESLGHVMLQNGVIMIGQFILLGLSDVLYRLPEMAADGLEAPPWLTGYHWAKPALILMGLWAAVGSNNMLLYLAGLSNVPQQLYEAAALDGASPWQRFYHVTWPQLAPVTFFIIITSVIGGLQGGFETARTMTNGGPAGSTMTLSYYVYREGFEIGRIGYASAIAWTLFLLVFGVTLFNWRFGNRYVNE